MVSAGKTTIGAGSGAVFLPSFAGVGGAPLLLPPPPSLTPTAGGPLGGGGEAPATDMGQDSIVVLPLGRVQPLVITAAITGAETTKAMNPNLPTTPEEQARDAAACVRAGASIIHLHVRDAAGNPTQSLDAFRASIEAIRAACDPEPIIQVSTGGAVGVPMAERVRPIRELHPEMATLSVGTINFGDDVFLNPLPRVRELAGLMRVAGVFPEVEIFDAGHLDAAKMLIAGGLLLHPIHFQFVLGVPGAMAATERGLRFLVESLEDPRDSWAVAGIGRHEMPMAELAIAWGGHVRVGMEDNIYVSRGQLAESNAQLVAMAAGMARAAGRPIASPDEARRILGIAPR